MELSLSGAKESGDGDCSSLRINASVSIMAEISALIGLVLSHPSSPPGEKSVFHHELRDDFFVGGDLTTRETAVPFLHFADNDESSLKRAMGLVLSVESFRLSILDGGYDDVSQAESIVLTIKDAVVECSVMNSRYRLNASIEDAQIDS